MSGGVLSSLPGLRRLLSVLEPCSWALIAEAAPPQVATSPACFRSQRQRYHRGCFTPAFAPGDACSWVPWLSAQGESVQAAFGLALTLTAGTKGRDCCQSVEQSPRLSLCKGDFSVPSNGACKHQWWGLPLSKTPSSLAPGLWSIKSQALLLLLAVSH